VELTEAYRECERITWTQARNFAYGIRLLPADKRRGLAVVYAFARRIDDIGDGTMPAEQKIAALEEARHAVLDLRSLEDPATREDPVLLALADVQRNFPVPMQAFGELIDGCVADVRGTSYETFEDLLHYCRCVAGSIGRLSLGIFGTSQDPEQAARLADSLGVALQLTNILRDVREDYQNGRVYLPTEDLAKFDVGAACLGGIVLARGDDPPEPPAHGGNPSPRTPLAPAHGGNPSPRTPLAPAHGGEPPPRTLPAPLTRLIEFEAERARDWYATGMRLLPMLDRRSAACTGAMAGIYRRLLDRIAAQPAAVLRGRVSLSAGEKAVVAVKALAGRTR
jgi:phytoene synthase